MATQYAPLSPPSSPAFSGSGSWLTFLVPTASVSLSVPVLLVVGFAPFFCMILFIVGLHNVLLAMLMMHWLCMVLVPLLYIYVVERSFDYYRHVWKIQRCRFRRQWPWAGACCLLALGGLYAAFVCAKAVGGSWFAGVLEGARVNCLSEGLALPSPLLLLAGIYFFLVNPIVEEWFWRVFLYREFGGAVFVSAPNGVLYMRESDPLLLSWCIQSRDAADASANVGSTAVAIPLTSDDPSRPASLALSPSRLRSAFQEPQASGQFLTAATMERAIAATAVEQGPSEPLGQTEKDDRGGGRQKQATTPENESLSGLRPRGVSGCSETETGQKAASGDTPVSPASACVGTQCADVGRRIHYLGESCGFVPADASGSAGLPRADCLTDHAETEGTRRGELRILPETIDEEDPETCPSPTAPVMTHVAPGVLQVDVRLSAAGQAMLSFFYASYHAVVFSTTVGLVYGFVALPCVAALGLLLTFFRNSSRFGILSGVFTHVGVDAAVVAILADVLQFL